MAFPTTSVIDSGAGANANPIGGSWSDFTPFYAAGSLQRTANQIAGTDAAGNTRGAYWNPATYGPDAEAFVTVPTLVVNVGDRIDLWLMLNAPTVSASTTGYRVRITRGTPWTFQLGRRAAGVTTSLGTAGTATPAAGAKFGLEVIGGVLTAYHFTGGSWVLVKTATDASPLTGTGFVGLAVDGTTARLTDFGGGTVVSGAAPARRTQRVLVGQAPFRASSW